MLRNSPCGGTSKAATIAVTTCVVSLLMDGNNNIFFKLVVELHMSPQLRWRSLTYRHRGCSATSQRTFKFLVANVTYEMTPRFFTPKRWNRFFAIYVVRLALYVCLKNIWDGVGGQDESNGTPLDPPLFWLDNIFKFNSLLANMYCTYSIPQLRTANEGPVRIQYTCLVPFMYSQKWNCYFQNRIIIFCFPVPMLIQYTVSVRDLYIPRISLPTLLQENMWSRGPILGIYKPLTDTWMWKLGLRPYNSQKRNTKMGFSLQRAHFTHF